MRVSVSAVFMLLWFAALLASVGLAGGLCFCCCRRFVVLVAVVVVVVFVGDVMVGASVSAVVMLLWFAASLASVGLAGGLCFCCCRRLLSLLLLVLSSFLLEMSSRELQIQRSSCSGRFLVIGCVSDGAMEHGLGSIFVSIELCVDGVCIVVESVLIWRRWESFLASLMSCSSVLDILEGLSPCSCCCSCSCSCCCCFFFFSTFQVQSFTDVYVL